MLSTGLSLDSCGRLELEDVMISSLDPAEASDWLDFRARLVRTILAWGLGYGGE